MFATMCKQIAHAQLMVLPASAPAFGLLLMCLCQCQEVDQAKSTYLQYQCTLLESIGKEYIGGRPKKGLAMAVLAKPGLLESVGWLGSDTEPSGSAAFYAKFLQLGQTGVLSASGFWKPSSRALRQAIQ